MSRTSGVLAAMKAVPGGARHTPAPQSGGYGTMNQVAANAMYGNPYSQSGYGPFLPRPSRTFTDGAFGPMPPIQPVPVDEPAIPGGFPDPRLWQYRVGWNLPTQPGTEGLKLASFQQLQTIAERYSVARRCIQLRKEEIAGLEWSIEMTTEAAMAYQGDHKAMRDFGERAAKATKFFKKPDPDYWNFASFLVALLEEIFVFDALSLIFRPKYGKGLGRGLLGSDLDSLSLVSGPTIRPLLGMHGQKPRPPAPAYQQFLYGVPRSDYQTIISGSDIDDYGLAGAEVNAFRADTMLYAPLVTRRETPYGFPPIEQALLPIISGLQKQEYQLSYYTEGCYSDDTEILTRNGWKLFAKLTDEDEVATRSESGMFEWELPSARLEYPFDGEMVEFSNKAVDLLVTPGHRMLVKRPGAYLAKHEPRDGERGWHVRLAEHIAGSPETRWLVPSTSSWQGTGPAEFVLPGWKAARRHPAHERATEFLAALLVKDWTPSADVLAACEKAGVSHHAYQAARKNLGIESRFFGGRGEACWWEVSKPAREYVPPAGGAYVPMRELRVPMEAFCAFLGVYLAEGWVRKDRDDVIISQAPDSEDLPEITAILDATGLTWNYDPRNMKFTTSHKTLAAWLRAHAGERAWGKHVPDGFKDYAPHLLSALLDGMVLGDGHRGPEGQFRYTTTSERLADDVQEISQKLGRDAWIRRESMKEYPGGFGTPETKHQTFVVHERLGGTHWLPVPKRAEYHGTVHCVTVPNGIVYVRRNGRAIWCGNTVPAVYISPGDPNITPTQVRELQDALNGIAGDPAYHMKVIVLPPGSKVEPQRPVDLADTFDTLVQTQVCMQLDVMPDELGLLPNVGSAGAGGSSNASALRFASGESRDPKSRKSTKPLLMTLCDIANYVLQGICGQDDMQFAFEGLAAEDDKQAIVDRGVQGIQNGLYSIDEVRGWLDLPPWGLPETSEPVVFTAQGPIPFSMAPEIIRAAITGNTPPSGQGTNSGQRSPSSRSRTSQPSVRAGGQTKPNGSHPAPVADHREAPLTPGHSAAAGAIQSPTPRTGGTTSRSSVAGSRKKAVEAELGALARHLRKGRLISTWEARHIPAQALSAIAEDIAKGVLIDTAVERAGDICLSGPGDAGDAPSGMRGILDKADADHLAAADHPHWPGWERDLGLVGAYKRLVGQAFHDAEARGSALRKKAATGGMFVSSGTLRGLIGDEVREVFSGVLTPLWTEAWNLGYTSAKSLVTGQPADFTVKHEGDALQGFLGTEGEHWLDEIARTGLGNNSARSELIARTEVGLAIASAALQCYRDHGVSHKHLLLSPGACDICKDAAEDGVIPLDAPFSSGGVLGLSHPADRCCPGPSWVDSEPPLADLGKADSGSVQPAEDESRAGFLMMRARHPDDGKWRYLLQKRPDGGWGLPGGSTHVGEDPHLAAVRESTEEIGDLPSLGSPLAVMRYPDDDKTVWIHLHEVPFFQPANNGSTPWETAGTGWFKRREVGDLDLHPPFRRQWEAADWKDVGKSLQRTVDENGQISELTPASQALQATGARWPYPHRADGAEWPDAGPGSYPGASPGGEPPNHINDMAEPEPHDTLEPRGGDDGEMPSRGRKPNPPASRFPDQGDEDQDAWPAPQATLTPGASTVGAPKSGGTPFTARIANGCSPSYHEPNCGCYKNDSGHPVAGAYKPSAPKPVTPGSVPPVTFDPAEAVEDWNPEADSDVVHDVGKGASDYTDANPVDPEHILSIMRAQFPEKALGWVKRAAWTGPQMVPWDRIDHEDEAKWAAAHEPAKVRQFVRDIKAGRHTNPSILFQPPGDGKVIVADGHHRAVARHSMGQDVLAYVAHIRASDREAAEQTHSFQFHGGSDPQNR